MNNLRYLLFLGLCIPIRALIACIAMTTNETNLQYMGYIAIIISIGFFYLFLTNSRQTGPEVFGEKIWWIKLRPVFGAFYAGFAYFAIRGDKNAWLFLAGDVVFGLISFIIHNNLN